MAPSKKEILDWQDRLTSAFAFQRTATGEMPERICTLTNAETSHGNRITTDGHGFRVLMLSYQDFAVRTLSEAPGDGNTVNVYSYAMNWAALRRLRSAWIVYNDGYYYDAGALLRGALETTMYLSCVLRGCFQFQRIHEVEDVTVLDSDNVDNFLRASRNHNRKLSAAVRDNVYGPSSGLSESERRGIEVLLWIHHSHVHRSESSVIREVVAMHQSGQLPRIFPGVDLYEASIFCNAAVLASWTHVRVLPYLAAPPRYSADWELQRKVLDEAFRTYIDAWEKPAKNAFLALIEKSFTFDEGVAYGQIQDVST